MDEASEREVADASDPRLIPGIYNYCNRRCEQCPFTDRCLTFRQMREDEMRHPGEDVLETVERSFASTIDLLKGWCEREGIDFEQVLAEARSESAAAASARIDAAIEADPLHELAFAYRKAAVRLVSSLEALAPFHEWPPAVREALATIGWYAGMVAAKVNRSLHGVACRDDSSLDEDPIQNDWNGSAKVARLAIAESQRAWDALLHFGQAPPDARLRQTRELLDQIDEGLARRFPHAADFVRPGFDEPEVAAGALSTLECYEPRRRRRRGVRAWLEQIAGGWQRRS
jgi:hypothetical protein